MHFIKNLRVQMHSLFRVSYRIFRKGGKTCIPFCCIICHFAAVYALKPPYYKTCADLKGGEGFRKGGGGGGGSPPSPSPPPPPPPPPVCESLACCSGCGSLMWPKEFLFIIIINLFKAKMKCSGYRWRVISLFIVLA